LKEQEVDEEEEKIEEENDHQYLQVTPKTPSR
jgi:hypothetical protein